MNSITPAARTLAVALLISMECGDNIARYLVAYQDNGGTWTIGIGSTFMPSGRRVTRGDAITYAEAVALCDKQIDLWAQVIGNAITTPLSDGWWAVLVSFVHQEGAHALPGSVLADMLNAGLLERGARQLNGWVIETFAGHRAPNLGIMRRMEAQRRMTAGAALKTTKADVWLLGAQPLLQLYDAACADAERYRSGVVTWEVHPAVTIEGTAPVHPAVPATPSINDASSAQQPTADELMAEYNPPATGADA